MGSPDFALPSLQVLHDSSHEIATVVSNVDKRRGRGGGVSPTPVKKRALELGYPVIGVEDPEDPDFEAELRECGADLFVIVAFRILPGRILEIPPRGTVNLHASLLPKYRGAAPIHWAIINGERKTGCTVFFVEEKVDSGKIILQRETPIGPDETTGDLYGRLKEMGGALLGEAVDRIEEETYRLEDQDESEATPAPKIYSEECKIDFSRPSEEVHNRIRGLSPVPGAWARLDGLRFNIYRSTLGPEEAGLRPGELNLEDRRLLAGCGKGSVELISVQIEGKRRMSGFDFMNGYSGTGVLH